MKQRRHTIQIIWGIALILAGIGVFFRIPRVMPKLEELEAFSSGTVFVRFCFYLIGCLLVGGGIKKLKDQFRQEKK